MRERLLRVPKLRTQNQDGKECPKVINLRKKFQDARISENLANRTLDDAINNGKTRRQVNALHGVMERESKHAQSPQVIRIGKQKLSWSFSPTRNTQNRTSKAHPANIVVQYKTAEQCRQAPRMDEVHRDNYRHMSPYRKYERETFPELQTLPQSGLPLKEGR